MMLLSGGGWLGAPREELVVLLEKAKHKDPKRFEDLSRRVLNASDERTANKEKLKATSNPPKKKRLSKLLGRKDIEFDEAMNEIAAIADGSDEEDTNEMDDLVVLVNEALVLEQSP